ncbi:MAG: hypothetical protein ACLGH0_09230, partial [Thermoanaerobaculia bacterium]
THLVVWEDQGIRGRILRGNEQSAVLQLDDGTGVRPFVTTDGSEFVVAWGDAGSQSVHLARVSAAGEIVRRSALVEVTWPTSVTGPTVACANGECLLAWREQVITMTCPVFGCARAETRVYAKRVDAHSFAAESERFALSGDDLYIYDLVASAAGDGTYALVWTSFDKTPVVVLDRAGVVRRFERAGSRPSLVRDGDRWLLVTDREGTIVATWFRATAPAGEKVLFADAQARRNAAVTIDGGRAVVAYERTTRNEAAGGVPRVYREFVGSPSKKRRGVTGS